MKQFVIALKSADFIKSGKNWATNAIDLYNNKWYTNYSISKSRYGLDLFNNRTFIGTEVIENATPTVSVLNSTPVYSTNYGEVLLDTNVIKYNVFQYDEINNQYYIFNLIEDASPYYILSPTSVSTDLYRFVDTTSSVDILNYKRSFY